MASRYNILLLVSQLQSELERVLAEAAGTRQLAESDMRSADPPPAADIFETERALIIAIEVPGLEAGDLTVQIENGHLSLRGRRSPASSREGTVRFRCMERSRGPFERLLRLPDTVDPRAVSARLAKGVLTVELPRISHERRGAYKVPIDVED